MLLTGLVHCFATDITPQWTQLTSPGVLQYVDFFDCTGTPSMLPASAADHSTVDPHFAGGKLACIMVILFNYLNAAILQLGQRYAQADA